MKTHGLADALNELVVAVNTVHFVLAGGKSIAKKPAYQHLLACRDDAIGAFYDASNAIAAADDEKLTAESLTVLRQAAIEASKPIGNMAPNGLLTAMLNRRRFEQLCTPEMAIKMIDLIGVLRTHLDEKGMLTSWPFFGESDPAELPSKGEPS